MAITPARGPMSELDAKWKQKQELEEASKKVTAGCDLIFEPFDVYRFGFKCFKEDKGIEVAGQTQKYKGCKAFVLNTTEEVLEKFMNIDSGWMVAPYDEKRRVTEKRFDMELPLTCRKEEFERVWEYLTKGEGS